MTYDTCRLTAKNRDRLRNPTLGNRVRATFTFQSRLLPRSATGSVADAGEKATRLPVATATAAAAGSTLPGGRAGGAITAAINTRGGADVIDAPPTLPPVSSERPRLLGLHRD